MPTDQQGPTGQPAYELVQEPAGTYVPLYDLIRSAHVSIDMTMYELADPTATADLIAAHRRGVVVRVLLDSAGAGGSVNAADYAELAAAGIDVRWGPPTVTVHEKAIAIDGRIAAVMTGNLTARYYANTRDAILLTRYPAQVSAIAATTGNDLDDTPELGASLANAGLVWSPGAETTFLNLIGSARSSIDLSSEELSDRYVINALEAAARRGVDVRVVMTADPEYTDDLDELAAAGVHVRTLPDNAATLYIHEKQLLVDGKTLIIGSQNIGVASLVYNRELSLELTAGAAPGVFTQVESTFDSDYNAGQP